MSINPKFTIVLCAASLVLAGLSIVNADSLDPATKARVERFEKGPASINVSGYPQGIQENYAVFSQKCTQCHKLSRPINSDYALPEEWSRYIKRMMNKPGSGISGGDAKKIYDFLVYDASVRKKSLLDSKLAQLSAADKATNESKIQQVHAKYGN
jgi:hypothetical protein